MRVRIVLKNRQLIFCTQVGDSLLCACQVDQDDVCASQIGTVLIHDFLELRSLRMAVRSGGRGEVDDHHLAEVVCTADGGAEAR